MIRNADLDPQGLETDGRDHESTNEWLDSQDISQTRQIELVISCLTMSKAKAWWIAGITSSRVFRLLICTNTTHWGIKIGDSYYDLKRGDDFSSKPYFECARSLSSRDEGLIIQSIPIGITHYSDEDLENIGLHLIQHTRPYQFWFDNCQHFAVNIFAKNIVCQCCDLQGHLRDPLLRKLEIPRELNTLGRIREVRVGEYFAILYMMATYISFDHSFHGLVHEMVILLHVLISFHINGIVNKQAEYDLEDLCRRGLQTPAPMYISKKFSDILTWIPIGLFASRRCYSTLSILIAILLIYKFTCPVVVSTLINQTRTGRLEARLVCTSCVDIHTSRERYSKLCAERTTRKCWPLDTNVLYITAKADQDQVYEALVYFIIACFQLRSPIIERVLAPMLITTIASNFTPITPDIVGDRYLDFAMWLLFFMLARSKATGPFVIAYLTIYKSLEFVRRLGRARGSWKTFTDELKKREENSATEDGPEYTAPFIFT